MGMLPLQFRGLNYRKFYEPFSLGDLFVQNVSDATNLKKQSGLHFPMLEDFSEIDLCGFTPSDVTRYIMKIKNSAAIPNSVSNNFVSCVSRNVGSFGLLRLYGVYSEIYGIRDEENFYVADNLLEAAEWLINKNGGFPEEAREAVNFFKRVA